MPAAGVDDRLAREEADLVARIAAGDTGFPVAELYRRYAGRLITVGTFTTGRSGTATVQIWSAADPRSYSIMQITAQTAGDGSQHGPVILTGTAAT